MAATPVIDLSSSPGGTQSKAPPSSHRLATVSASEALQDLEDTTSGHVRTGLPSLDAALAGASTLGNGGLERKKVTEIWGPNGAGTTAVALQASANVLKDGNGVAWVDCATPLAVSRLESLLALDNPLEGVSSPTTDGLQKFHHVTAPTLSHLLALILHPPADLLSPKTSLLAIDNVNTLLDLDYPRAQAIGSHRTEAQKWQAGRRYAVLGSLTTALNKLSALNNLAVLVTTGCAMRTRPDSGLGGALAPGVGGQEWDAGIWYRLVVFRDFGGRFVGVQKGGGKSLISRQEIGEAGRIFGFDIDPQTGVLKERQQGRSGNGAVAPAKMSSSSPAKSRKRYIDEVADSEGEDEYGWGPEDEDVLATDAMTCTGAQAEQNDSTT